MIEPFSRAADPPAADARTRKTKRSQQPYHLITSSNNTSRALAIPNARTAGVHHKDCAVLGCVAWTPPREKLKERTFGTLAGTVSQEYRRRNSCNLDLFLRYFAQTLRRHVDSTPLHHSDTPSTDTATPNESHEASSPPDLLHNDVPARARRASATTSADTTSPHQRISIFMWPKVAKQVATRYSVVLLTTALNLSRTVVPTFFRFSFFVS